MKINKFTSFSILQSDYLLRPASSDDAEEIWSIMNYCSQTMKHKEHFICDNLDYVKDILTNHGFGVVACDKTRNIVGNLLVKYPGDSPENLGHDVFLPTEINLEKVVHMDSSCVLPQHRGHHLECHMITFAEKLIDKTNYIYAFATVAPQNTASLKSLETCGYRVMVTKEKYNGVLRCVVMKHLC